MTNNDDILRYVLARVRSGDYEVSGFRLLMDCPLPECRSARKSRHFYVNREWFGWRCYRQGRYGSLRDLVLDDPRLWTPVRSIDQNGTGRRESPRAFRGSEDLSLLSRPSEWASVSLVRRAYEYVLSRGVTPAQVLDYRISLKQYDGRVWFPYWQDGGEVTFRMGRVIADDPGVKTIEEFTTPVKPLYGLHVREPTDGFCVLVEGVFDHFVTPNSYAIMGSHVTAEQWGRLDELRDAGKIERIFMLLDPDAKDKTTNVVTYLRRKGLPVCGVMLERTQDDPGKLGVGTMTRIVRQLQAISLRRLRAEPFLTAYVLPPSPDLPSRPTPLLPPQPDAGSRCDAERADASETPSPARGEPVAR